MYIENIHYYISLVVYMLKVFLPCYYYYYLLGVANQLVDRQTELNINAPIPSAWSDDFICYLFSLLFFFFFLGGGGFWAGGF